jgi:hypothetical protein
MKHSALGRLAATALALLLVVVAAACGGDDGSTSAQADAPAATSTTPPTSPAPPTTAVTPAPPATGAPDAQPYIDALITNFSGDESISLEPSQAECVAPRIVDVIGVDALRADGVEPEDLANSSTQDLGLTEEQGFAVYDAFVACGFSWEDYLVDGFVAQYSLSAERADCVRGALDEVLMRDDVADLLRGVDVSLSGVRARVANHCDVGT